MMHHSGTAMVDTTMQGGGKRTCWVYQAASSSLSSSALRRLAARMSALL